MVLYLQWQWCLPKITVEKEIQSLNSLPKKKNEGYEQRWQLTHTQHHHWVFNKFFFFFLSVLSQLRVQSETNNSSWPPVRVWQKIFTWQREQRCTQTHQKHKKTHCLFDLDLQGQKSHPPNSCSSLSLLAKYDFFWIQRYKKVKSQKPKSKTQKNSPSQNSDVTEVATFVILWTWSKIK